MCWEGICECGCGKQAGQGHSPASVTKHDVKWISLSGLARLRNQAVGVEHHWVLVDLWVMQEVPIIWRSEKQERDTHKM